MDEHFLQTLGNVLVVAFIVDSMLAMGLSLSLREVLKPLADVRVVARALVANFVLATATAYMLVQIFHLQHGVAIGLILMGCSAGDPFAPKLTGFAEGDRAFSLAVMVLLSIFSILYLPIVAPLLLTDVEVNAWSIAKPLLALIFTPLIVGFAVRRFFPAAASRLAPLLDRLASLLVLAVLVELVVTYFWNFVALFGSGAMLSSAILLALSGVYGYVLGGPTRTHKNDLALNTGYRGLSAAIAIGIANFPDQHDVVVLPIFQAFLSTVVLVPLTMTVMRRINNADARATAR